MRESKSINSLLENGENLGSLAQTFAILDELNKILQHFLPRHLVKYCHIGAIDNDKNLIILYLADPALQHIISNLANPILECFNSHHFSFAGVITRIRPNATNKRIRLKRLDASARQKLEQLAQSINKPELIVNNIVVEAPKEIYF